MSDRIAWNRRCRSCKKFVHPFNRNGQQREYWMVCMCEDESSSDGREVIQDAGDLPVMLAFFDRDDLCE